MIHDTQSAQISQKDGHNIYVIMLSYVYTSCAQVHEFPQSHCGDNREPGGHIVFMIRYVFMIYIYIYVCVCVYIYIHKHLKSSFANAFQVK